MRLTRYFTKVIAVFALSAAAFAQPQPATQDDSYDPDSASRGVARISVMNGDVSVRRGDSGDFVAAAINAPLVVGDRILTGPNSRAEVQFDWANMIRIGPNSEIRLSELAYRRYQVQLAQGLATFRVLRSSDADVEVSTPQVSIRPKREGIYRMSVHEDGVSEVTVRAGEVEVFTPRGVETLRAGRTMQVRGTASDPEYQVVSAYREDDWDRWNRNRDRDLERSASYRYVDRDIYGADDLDDYGQWVSDSTYGYVWTPRVASGWAPYRSGRWVWIDWYGWSWVSYDPWGWAPYHYGRWYQSPRYGWCWYPGGRGFGGRHYWSPALVAFVGFGHGGVGFGFGNIGWIPLAPYERYHRWYGRGYYGGNHSVTNITVVNNVNIYNNYRNARIHNAVTTVDGQGFARGAAGRAWRSSDGDFQRASLVQGQLPVTPGRESLRLSDREARHTAATRSPENERFYSRRQPAQVERVPFENQRRSIEQASSGFNQSTPRTDVVRRAAEQSPSSSQVPRQDASAERQERQNGWRRFGEPPSGTVDRVDRTNSRTQGSGNDARNDSGAQRGWGRFGGPGATVDRSASRTEQRQQRTESQPRTESQSQPQVRTEQSLREGNDRWRGFERPQQTTPNQDPNPSRVESSPRVDRGSFGRFERQGNIDRSERSRSAAPESVRISPPVVRERSTPRSESPLMNRERPQRNESARPSGGDGGGGGARQGGEGGGHQGGGDGGGRVDRSGGGGGRSESRGGRNR